MSGIFKQLIGGGKQRRLKYALAVVCVGLACKCLALSPNAKDPVRVRFVTFNVNFNNNATKISEDIGKVESRADVIFTQESKRVTIADYLDSATWAVYQITNQGDAKRGSAVAYRKAVVSRRIAAGLQLGVAAGEAEMLDRYMAWVDLELSNGQVIRAISLHMPPQRYVQLQTPMANNLASFTNNAPYPVIAGADWNFTVMNDPRNIQMKCCLVPQGVGIDGFFYNSDVASFVSKNQMTGLGVNSDHYPVQMIAQVYNIAPPQSAVDDWSLY